MKRKTELLKILERELANYINGDSYALEKIKGIEDLFEEMDIAKKQEIQSNGKPLLVAQDLLTLLKMEMLSTNPDMNTIMPLLEIIRSSSETKKSEKMLLELEVLSKVGLEENTNE